MIHYYFTDEVKDLSSVINNNKYTRTFASTKDIIKSNPNIKKKDLDSLIIAKAGGLSNIQQNQLVRNHKQTWYENSKNSYKQSDNLPEILNEVNYK